MRKTVYASFYFLSISFLCGCTAMMIGGGKLLSKSSTPPKILVAYDTEGTVPAGVEYFLVETEEGPAMFERNKDGSGVLFQVYWSEKGDDHFASWIKGSTRSSHAYEFVIPKDRSENGKKFVYPAFTWTKADIKGIVRPIPRNRSVEAVATLIPK